MYHLTGYNGVVYMWGYMCLVYLHTRVYVWQMYTALWRGWEGWSIQCSIQEGDLHSKRSAIIFLIITLLAAAKTAVI